MQALLGLVAAVLAGVVGAVPERRQEQRVEKCDGIVHGEVCHPAAPLDPPVVCAPLRPLLRLRSRLSRLLLRADVALVVPRDEWSFLQAFALADRALSIEKSFGSRICPSSPEQLHLMLAVVCAGLLEAEALALPNAAPAECGLLANASALALPAALGCPWARLAATGWPLFALLARFAGRLAAKLGGERLLLDACPSEVALGAFLRGAFARGLQVPPLPPESLAVPLIDGAPAATPAAAAAAAKCLWEAADALSMPRGPICVTVPSSGSPKPLVAARDCNRRWPACPDHETRSAAAPLHFWVQLPPRRDVAADSIREEQQPFCINNHDGALVTLVAELAAAIREEGSGRPLVLVEVGSHYGDCTLLVHAAARRAGCHVQATVFEANIEAVGVLRGNLEANAGARAAVRVRHAAVGSRGGGRARLLVPESSAHAALNASAVGGSDVPVPPRVQEVETVSLDDELRGARIDLLLISVNRAELDVLEGARGVLSKHRARVVVALTWSWKQYRLVLEGHGYCFERRVQFGGTDWAVARAPQALRGRGVSGPPCNFTAVD